jgi:hypothetical protein
MSKPFLLLLLLGASRCYALELSVANTPVVGGPCQGCEAVFVGLPGTLSSQERIAPADERGEPLRIEGRVFDAEGQPRAGVIVYAYQTNAEGVYPPATQFEDRWARRHGQLRAWAQTDAQGGYVFETIRPASYPDSRIPQHVHLHVIEPGCATYYIDDLRFSDDPLLPDSAGGTPARGGSGLATPELGDGIWRARRDIQLGQNIPGHTGCEAPKRPQP